MAKVVLTVKGMKCEGCLAAVTAALRAAPGVTDAQVDLASGRAEVEYDAVITSPEKLVAAEIFQRSYSAEL